MKRKWISFSEVFLIAMIILTGAVLVHILDLWTVPVQNDVMIAQLNGGDSDMVIMKSTNSLLTNLRLAVWPLVILICALLSVLKVFSIIKFLSKKDQKTNR